MGQDVGWVLHKQTAGKPQGRRRSDAPQTSTLAFTRRMMATLDRVDDLIDFPQRSRSLHRSCPEVLGETTGGVAAFAGTPVWGSECRGRELSVYIYAWSHSQSNKPRIANLTRFSCCREMA